MTDFIITKSKVWFSISGALAALSIGAIAAFGLNFGIDFTGGSLLEVSFQDSRPELAQIDDKLSGVEIGSMTLQPVENNGLILRFQNTTEEKHQSVLFALSEMGGGEIDQMRFEAVGPSVGAELKRKSVWAISLVLIAIVLFVGWTFRQVSKEKLPSWKYGVIAVIALFHDVLITVGLFAVLGQFLGTEINTPFIAAILTVLGYSVNDTIVVFDRIRENLFTHKNIDFTQIASISVKQTITRSVNSSLTTLLVLFAIFFFGGDTIKDFVLALIFGIAIGTYSSVFIAAPLLVAWAKK